MELRIEALAARPEFVTTVATWIYEQWWTQVPGASVQTLSGVLRENLQPVPMPLTLVASSGAHPVGTVSILAHDVGTRRWALLSPWLAALYVVPGARRHGVGAALVQAALARAAAFAAGTLYLLTTDQEAYYARRGWLIVDRHEGAVVMGKALR